MMAVRRRGNAMLACGESCEMCALFRFIANNIHCQALGERPGARSPVQRPVARRKKVY